MTQYCFKKYIYENSFILVTKRDTVQVLTFWEKNLFRRLY